MQIITETEAAQRSKELAAQDAAEQLAAKNRNFVQLKRESMKPFRGLIRRSPVSAQVLTCLAEDMSFANAIGYSVEALILETGAGRTAVYEALARLVAERWIQKLDDDNGTYYRVNSRVFWTSSNDFRSGSFDLALDVPKEERPGKTRRRTRKVVVARVVAKRASARKPASA